MIGIPKTIKRGIAIMFKIIPILKRIMQTIDTLEKFKSDPQISYFQLLNGPSNVIPIKINGIANTIAKGSNKTANKNHPN